MSQFTLYANLSPDSRDAYPYFVDVQNDLLDSLSTRLVVPLTPASYLGGASIQNLCPVTMFQGSRFVLLTHQMTNVPVAALRSPVGSLADLRGQILAAIDFLVTGI